MCRSCNSLRSIYPTKNIRRSFTRRIKNNYIKISPVICCSFISYNPKKDIILVYTPTKESFDYWFPHMRNTQDIITISNRIGEFLDRLFHR